MEKKNENASIIVFNADGLIGMSTKRQNIPTVWIRIKTTWKGIGWNNTMDIE